MTISAMEAVPYADQTPQAFQDIFKADRQRAKHRNAHFTSSALLSEDGTDTVVLGTTLGDIYSLNMASLASYGQQEVSSVVQSSWTAHRQCVNALCTVSGDGQHQVVASSGSDSCIKMWKNTSPEDTPSTPLRQVTLIDIPRPAADELAQQRPPDALCLAACSDAKVLRAATTSGSVLTYDLVAAGGPALHHSHSAHVSPIADIAQHPRDDAVFCTASDDGTAAVWDARVADNSGCVSRVHPSAGSAPKSTAKATMEPTAEGYRSFVRQTPAEERVAVTCCEFDSTGRWLAMGCADGSVNYYSLLTQEITGQLQFDSAPQALCRSGPDLYVGCSRGEFYTGGFLAEDVSAFQKHVVLGRPSLTSIVAQQRPLGQAGMVVACGSPGTVLGMNTMLRVPLCTVQCRIEE